MGRFLTLGGLGKIWDNIKGRLIPDINCLHTNRSPLITTSWCIGTQMADCGCEDEQTMYICKNCGKVFVTSGHGCEDCDEAAEEAIWNNNLNEWVDPTIFMPWTAIQQDPLYTTQYSGSSIGALINTDYIIETGTINNWTYQKWNNGMIELYQDYYSKKSFAQGTGGNNILLLIIKDTDNFPFTPLASFTTAGITGHNTPIVEYSRVSYSSNMDQTFSEAGYYLDTYIYCPNGPYNGVYFWLRPYVVGTWK